VIYDYAQPVVVTTYDDSIETTPVAPVSSSFDQGLGLFKSGAYAQSLPLFDAAIKEQPGDAAAHEVRALNLFALGEYGPAAATLNSLLTSAPGMDWTTMSGLYGNVADYTAQLRNLEAYCKANPNDAASHFVLAYHYLVTGYQDDAVRMLKVVVANQPRDVTASRMLEALTTPAVTPPIADPAENPGPLLAPPVETTPAAPSEQTDLVGTWQAKAGDTTIDLVIGEDSKFTWSASQPNQPKIVVSGDMSFTSEALEFDSAEQGAMAGSVDAAGPNKWIFRLDGAPPEDPGLTFNRVK